MTAFGRPIGAGWLASTAAACCIIVATGEASGLLPTSIAGVVAAGTLGLVAWRVRPSLIPADLARVASLFVASLLVEALPEFVGFGPASSYEFARRAVVMLPAWGVCLALLAVRSGPRPALEPSTRTRWDLPLLLAFSAIVALGAHWLLRQRYAAIPDEVLYVAQSRAMFRPGFTLPVDAQLAPFVVGRLTYLTHGGLATQYPPGWPLLLALCERVGLRWFAPPVMSVIAVLATYRLGRQIGSRAVGLLAGALLATTYEFVFLSSTYMSNIASMALAVAASALLMADPSGVRKRTLTCVGSGVLLGTACMVRPLTGAALGVSICAWIAMRKNWQAKRTMASALWVAAGALAPLVFLAYYNVVLNGSPFVSGYAVANQGLSALGFGTRGILLHGADGSLDALASEFSLHVAVLHALRMLRAASLQFSPAFMIAPVLSLAWLFKVRYRLAPLVVFSLLPASYFFYWYEDVRFYSELLPFVCVFFAWLLVEISRREPRMAWLVLFVLGINTVFMVQSLAAASLSFHRRFLPYFRQVEVLKRHEGKLLLFVRDEHADPRGPVLFEALSWYDTDGYSGDVIVVRDRGRDNAILAARWPDRHAFVVRDSGDARQRFVREPSARREPGAAKSLPPGSESQPAPNRSPL